MGERGIAREFCAPMTAPPARPRRRLSAPTWLIVLSIAVVVLVGGLFAVVRYGPLTSAGRLLIEAQASGLKIGRLGRLRVEGVRGDIWRSFTIDRLSIADDKGVWLDARNLDVQWRYAELFRRRLHIDFVSARQVSLIRRPTLTPEEKSSNLPVSFEIDAAKARIEMAPSFSWRRGVYDLRTAFSVERAGGAVGQGSAESVLHPGDHLHIRFDVGRTRSFVVAADAVEARGGALAGMLGLVADQPFTLTAMANGSTGAGHFTLASRVGGTTPIEGIGAWNAAGGSADVHLALAASSLLAGYQKISGRIYASTSRGPGRRTDFTPWF